MSRCPCINILTSYAGPLIQSYKQWTPSTLLQVTPESWEGGLTDEVWRLVLDRLVFEPKFSLYELMQPAYELHRLDEGRVMTAVVSLSRML